MISYCDICKEIVSENWCLRISDNTCYTDVNGHKVCIETMEKKIKAINDVHKKTVSKVLKEINFQK